MINKIWEPKIYPFIKSSYLTPIYFPFVQFQKPLDYIYLDNKDIICNNIDKALCCNKPRIEYIVSMPFAAFTLFGYGIGPYIYGHSAIRIVTYEGDKIINIEHKSTDPNFIKVYDTSDYMFTNMSQQGGMINRNIISIRFEEISNEEANKMLEYYKKISIEATKGNKKFTILLGPLLNRLFPQKEYGNCSKWISEGLKAANLLNKTYVWPRSIWVKLFEKYTTRTNVVYYKHIKHLPQRYGIKTEQLFSSIAPFQLFRNWCYSNCEGFANCIVQVNKENPYIGIVKINEKPYKSSKYRNIVNHPIIIISSIIVTSLLYYRFGRLVLKKFKFLNKK